MLLALPALLFLEEVGLTEEVGLGTAADAARGDALGIIGPKPGGLIGSSGTGGTAGGSGGKTGQESVQSPGADSSQSPGA